MTYTIINGDSADVLKQYDNDYFDSVVCDPPYGIEFLAKDWDNNTGAIEVWQECFRVLKPGGHLLAFSAARTYHKLATNIEACGFEIRDQLMWIYMSGFPKAQDVGKNNKKRLDKLGLKDHTALEDDSKFYGWKTGLKPAHEPIVMARKHMIGSTVVNMLEHGVGALNIEACRIPYEDDEDRIAELGGDLFEGDNISTSKDSMPGQAPGNGTSRMTFGETEPEKWNDQKKKSMPTAMPGGSSWHDMVSDGGQPGRPKSEYNKNAPKAMKNVTALKVREGQPKSKDEPSIEEYIPSALGRFPSNVLGDLGGYEKFFMCPKVGRKERHIGYDLDDIPTDPSGMYENHYTGDNDKAHHLREKHKMQKPGNIHPTVKPVELMAYLVKLVTPPNGKVLDPFCGSGSTGMACVEYEFDFTGIELDEKYVEISNKRIEAWDELKNPLSEEFFKKE